MANYIVVTIFTFITFINIALAENTEPLRSNVHHEQIQYQDKQKSVCNTCKEKDEKIRGFQKLVNAQQEKIFLLEKLVKILEVELYTTIQGSNDLLRD